LQRRPRRATGIPDGALQSVHATELQSHSLDEFFSLTADIGGPSVRTPSGDQRILRRAWLVCGHCGPELDTDSFNGAFFAAATRAMSARTVGVRRLVDLASRQFGVVNRADLEIADVSWKWLRGRLATGEWKRVHRGVFRLGCIQPTLDEREMAAVVAAGDGAVLSHKSAARRLGLDVPRDESVHITIHASRKAKVRGAKVWRSRSIGSRDIGNRGLLRLTNLPRTLIDLAAILDDGELRAAFDSALRQNTANAAWISRVLNRHGPGRRGVGRLRALVDEYRRGDEVADSALESLGVELAKATGREPRLHLNVADGAEHVAEVDLAWPEQKLCVQFDGWKIHNTRAAFVRDRKQDRSLIRLGWTVLRYPWEDVVHDFESAVDDLVRSFQARDHERLGRKASSKRAARSDGSVIPVEAHPPAPREPR